MNIGLNQQKPSLVSVCIPTYNRCETLKKAIACVLRQTHANIELIVVDNASTDRTKFVVEEFIQKGAFIKYQKSPKNIGAVRNFVKGMSLATGDYCMWLADDDWQDENYVEKCLYELEMDTELVLVAGRCHYFDAGTPTRFATNTKLLSAFEILRLLKFYLTVGDASVFYGLYRKEVLEGVAFKNILGGDWFFIAAVALRGKIKTIQSTHLNRDEHGASTDLTGLANELGYSPLLSKEPYLIVCIEAFRDVVNEKIVYGHLGTPLRYLLAVCIFLIIFIKKILLQKIYRIVRTIKNYIFTQG